jgi:hypothetical protein
VADTLSQVTVTAICYLSLDMNNTTPEIAAAERFWDRLVPGGIIVLDDYGWRKQINQKIAFASNVSKWRSAMKSGEVAAWQAAALRSVRFEVVNTIRRNQFRPEAKIRFEETLPRRAKALRISGFC